MPEAFYCIAKLIFPLSQSIFHNMLKRREKHRKLQPKGKKFPSDLLMIHTTIKEDNNVTRLQRV